MFACSPELAVSMLFCAVMQRNEAIIITGAERFSSYAGYGFSLRYGGNYVDSRARVGGALAVGSGGGGGGGGDGGDMTTMAAAAAGAGAAEVAAGTLESCVIAIDALPAFSRRVRAQYSLDYIARELLKAYAGFSAEGAECGHLMQRIATGKWGCGAFGGEPQLKAVVQWLAASRAGRTLVFCVFDGGMELVGELRAAVAAAVSRAASVAALFRALLAYVADAPDVTLLEHIRRTFS